MKRIVLFVATNVAVLAVIYLVLNILGVERIVTADGTRLDLGALLTFSAVVGFAGSFGYYSRGTTHAGIIPPNAPHDAFWPPENEPTRGRRGLKVAVAGNDNNGSSNDGDRMRRHRVRR